MMLERTKPQVHVYLQGSEKRYKVAYKTSFAVVIEQKIVYSQKKSAMHYPILLNFFTKFLAFGNENTM